MWKLISKLFKLGIDYEARGMKLGGAEIIRTLSMKTRSRRGSGQQKIFIQLKRGSLNFNSLAAVSS